MSALRQVAPFVDNRWVSVDDGRLARDGADHVPVDR
jgi:hypothetical protein